MRKFFQELQRRNVIKSALAYLVVAWLITQVMAILTPAFELPAGMLRATIVLVVIVFPFWILFSWVYEITPEGIKLTKNVVPEHSISSKTSNRLNYVIISSLVVAIMLLTYNITSQQRGVSEIISEDVPEDFLNAEIGRVGGNKKSIAVLAFADMSANKDQEYFSDGISEEILNLLAKVEELKVISRTSSFAFKGKDLGIKDIGEKLNVTHVLEGSIRTSGNTFRITAQLIDVATGGHIWSETYDHVMEDIFEIQDEIATKVTQQLGVSILDAPFTTTSANTEAYKLYLQAVYSNVRTVEGLTNAKKLFKASIAIDSSYAPTWAGLSNCFYYDLSSFLTIPMSEALEHGGLAAKKAIDLDSEYIGGYISLSRIEHASWNFKRASQLLDKAQRLKSNSASVLMVKSGFAVNHGKLDLAIKMHLELLDRDPLRAFYYQYYLGFYYWMKGQLDKAEESFNHFLVSYADPNDDTANGFAGWLKLSSGDPKAALSYFEKDARPFWGLHGKSMAVYAMGDIQKANELLDQLIVEWGDSSWPNIAEVYAFRNENNEAFKWLDLAFQNKDSSLLEILNYPAMKNLWGDPRWNQFINKLGLPDDHGFHLD